MIKKGTKVYFKVGTHKGYRKGIVKSISNYTLTDKRNYYRVKPTDQGSKPTMIYGMLGSKLRRR